MSRKTVTHILAIVLVISFAIPATFLIAPQRTVAAEKVSCLASLGAGVVAYLLGTDVPDVDKTNAGINAVTSVSSLAECIYTTVLVQVARGLIRAALQKMTASVIDFINGNNGSGSPSYVQNISVSLRGVGDAAGLSFISQVGTALKSSPFAASIQSSLQTVYSQGTSLAGFFAANQCTLVTATRSLADVNAFLSGNWSRGGASAWLSLTTQSQNNPYMLYQDALGRLQSNVTQAQTNRRQDLIQSGGFLSWCAGDTTSSSACVATNTGSCPSGCVADDQAATGCSPTGAKPQAPCTNPDGTPAQASTPGSVIMSYAQANINSGIGQLVSAQDLDGALSQIVSALANKVIGSTGLFGSTRSSGSTGTGGSATPATDSSSSSAAAQARDMANAAQTRLDAYKAGVQTVSAAASRASAALTDLINVCTTASATTFASHISAAQNAIATETGPLLLLMQKALTDVDATQALIDTVKEQATIAATPAGAPATFETNLGALITAPPLPTDLSAIQSAAAVTNGAIVSGRDTGTGAPTGSSLMVRGGSKVDQMNLIAVNASVLKAQCVPPVVDPAQQGGGGQ